MKNLQIGLDGFELPIELATGSTAILATKGGGKSYTAAVIVEELIARGVPSCFIDPTGAHWGLKSSASGKSAGLAVTIFGGDHADLPLQARSGEVIARWFVEKRFNAILDLSHFKKAEIFQFLTPFLSELYRLNREPVQLVADEADLYAPQFVGKAGGLVPACLGAMEDIVRRGRKNGIGSTLITQRPASINKDVLTQCDCLLTMRIGHPRDVEPVMEWIEMNGDLDTAKEMLASLPSLPTGTAWIWAPTFKIFERVQIRKRTTFDSSRTPKIGERMIVPTAFAKIDLEALGKEIQNTIEEAKANDPAALKMEIGRLRGVLAKSAKIALADAARKMTPPAPVVREVAVLDIGAAELMRFTGQQLKLAHDDFQRIEKSIAALATRIKRNLPHGNEIIVYPASGPSAGKTETVRPADVSIGRPEYRISPNASARTALLERTDGGKDLSACERAILAAASTRYPKPSSKSQLAVISGYSVTSSSYQNALSSLRTQGLISGYGDAIELTGAGLTLAPPAGAQDGDSVRALWLGKLGGCERKILEWLIEHYPMDFHKDAIAEATGYSVTSSSFQNSMSKLRTLELITRGPAVKATETLFP